MCGLVLRTGCGCHGCSSLLRLRTAWCLVGCLRAEPKACEGEVDKFCLSHCLGGGEPPVTDAATEANDSTCPSFKLLRVFRVLPKGCGHQVRDRAEKVPQGRSGIGAGLGDKAVDVGRVGDRLHISVN